MTTKPFEEMTIGELMDRVKAVMKKLDLSRDAAVVVVMCEIHAEADAKNASWN